MRSTMVLTSLVLMMILSVSTPKVWGRDPDLVTDFGINVTNSADLKFTGFTGVPDSPVGKLSITFAFLPQFPALNGLGVGAALLKFGPDSINSLHTHPRASELFIVLSGTIEAGIVDTTNRYFTTTLRAGNAFVFPIGTLHFQINRSPTVPVTAIACFGSENAGRLSLTRAIFNSMPPIETDFLERAFDLDAKTVERLKRTTFSTAVNENHILSSFSDE